MKLLFCPECWDVFKLARVKRSCECGLVTGQYLEDGHNSINNGKGVSMAMDNNFVMFAIGKMHAFAEDDPRYDRFYEDARIPFWVRPNEGAGNPRSKVVADESEVQ